MCIGYQRFSSLMSGPNPGTRKKKLTKIGLNWLYYSQCYITVILDSFLDIIMNKKKYSKKRSKNFLFHVIYVRPFSIPAFFSFSQWITYYGLLSSRSCCSCCVSFFPISCFLVGDKAFEIIIRYRFQRMQFNGVMKLFTLKPFQNKKG